MQNAMNRRDMFKIGGIMGALAVGSLLSPLNARSAVFSKPTRDRPLLLNSNENMHGYSQRVKSAIQSNLEQANLYPYRIEEELYKTIASLYSVRENMLCISNGSSGILQASVYAAYKMANSQNKPLRLVVADPTFEFVEMYAKAFDIEVVKIDLDRKFEFDIDAMKKAERSFDGISLVYICNPNNPTGSIIRANDLYSWVRNAKDSTIFLLDEAYAEYVTDRNFRSGIDMVKGGIKNLIVVRTLSKIYGLAGLRVGYSISSPDLKRAISEFLQLDCINAFAVFGGVAALNDFNFKQYCINANIKSKQLLMKYLDSVGLRYAPSHGNFVFHEINGDFDKFYEGMKNYNIMVGRKFPKYDNFCRITLGTVEQMKYYIKVMGELRKVKYA